MAQSATDVSKYVYTLDDWKNIGNGTKTEGGVTYNMGTQLAVGSNNHVNFAGINNLYGAPAAASSMKSFTGSVKLGIYQNTETGLVQAFASTAATGDAPATIGGGWKLIASGTGSTGSWKAGTGISIGKMDLKLASGAGQVLGFNSTSVVSITGSAGADAILINATGVSAKSVLTMQGEDKIYFLGASTIGQLNAGSGLSLISSADASSEGGVVVLGSAISTSAVFDGHSGDSLSITTNAKTASKLDVVSTSGNVILQAGKAQSTISVGDVLGGKLKIDTVFGDEKAAKVFEGGTLTGGTITMAKKGQNDTVTIKEIAGADFVHENLQTGSVKIDTVSSGSVKLTFGDTGGNGTTVSSAVTGGKVSLIGGSGGTLIGGSGTVLKEATVLGATTANGGLTLGGTNAMSIVASAASGDITFAGSGADVINLSKINATSKIAIQAGTSADTVSVSNFGAGAQVTLQSGTTANTGVVLASGTSMKNAAVSTVTDGIKIAGASDAVSIVGATVLSAGAEITGSSKADYFNFETFSTGSNKTKGITLTGGSGDDAYNFSTGVAGQVTITDFGWSTSAEEAVNAASGQDVILVANTGSTTLGKITWAGGILKVGSDNIIAKGDESQDNVYIKIAETANGASTAKTYRVNANGAKVVGSDSPNTVTGQTGSDGVVTFNAASEEHAYMNAGSNDAIVKNMTAYNGTNDRTASIINTAIDLENMTQTTDASGNVTLAGTDSDPTVTIENLGTGKAIKVGDLSNQTAVVLGAATGVTTVESAIGDQALTTAYIGDSTAGSFFDFSQTAKTTIDLSGASTVDGATYKNVKGVKASDDGKSLLVSGSSGVTLEAAGAGDTLSGAGAGADTLVSASGKATNFLLSSGNGSDVVSNFSFGTGSNNDKILISDTGFGEYADAETLVSATNGRVKIGNDNGTLSISASGQDTVALQYNFGGSNPGTIILDTSENGTTLNFASGGNIIMGQSGATTVKAASGDDVEPKNNDQPAGIGWNSNYIASNVGVIDVSASNMTAVNGQKNSSDMVIAATGESLEGPIWVCGGIGANFSDKGNDTLVASGQGNNEIFVGAKMGNDVIQNISSKDVITFIDTKVSDFGGIDEVLKIDSVTGKTFTATFTNTAGEVTTIKGTTQLAMDKTTNLTFHFDDTDYVWDGKTLTEATA